MDKFSFRSAFFLSISQHTISFSQQELVFIKVLIMDPRHLHSAPAFSSQPPHAYSQAPSSQDHPLVSSHTHQQHLQPHQTSRPYPSSQDQARMLALQHWLYNSQQPSNAMMVTEAPQPVENIGIGNNNNRNHFPTQMFPGEDFVNLHDQSVMPSRHPMQFQHMQSLPQSSNTVRGSPTLMGQTDPRFLSSIQSEGNLQFRMDNTIHQTQQPEMLSQHHPFGPTLGHQTPGMQQADAYQNYAIPQQQAVAEYVGSQYPFVQAPFQQTPVAQGLFSHPKLPVIDPRLFQYAMGNNPSGSTSYKPNRRSNTLAKNTHSQGNPPRDTNSLIVSQKESNAKAGSIPVVPVVPSPGVQQAADENQTEQTTNPVVPLTKLETGPHSSVEDTIINQQIAKIVSPPTGPRSQLQQWQAKPKPYAVPGKRSPRNRQAIPRSRNVPTTQINTSKDSGQLPEKSRPQHVVAQSQTAKRIVRKVLYNPRAGEVTQVPGKEVVRKKSAEVVEPRVYNKEEVPFNKDKTISNLTYSPQPPQPHIEMPSTNSKTAPNSGQRLLSFDELFRASNDAVEQAPRPLIPLMTEAGKERPLTLNELMQLRDAAAASKSSNSTVSG